MIVNIIYGFLGAGKTTFIRHMLDHPPDDEKVVILVNEFGEIGLDGLILADQRNPVADVVELPSGCICCTLAGDFRRQFLEITEKFGPDRIIVEPTGVATISQVMQILQAEDIRCLYSHSQLIHILDSSEFLEFIRRQRHFMENQLRRSSLVILNKIDRVKPHVVDLLIESVREINPAAMVYPATFGRLDPEIVKRIIGKPLPKAEEERVLGDLESEPEPEHTHGNEFADRFSAFGRKYEGTFDQLRLESFFERLGKGDCGEVVRAKGIFRTQREWIKIELASGEVRVEPAPAAPQSMVSIVGLQINTGDMESGLADCKT